MNPAAPLNLVRYDAKLKILQQALGTHTRSPQQQGTKLKMRREIRVATLFREAPAEFLKMIVVHELAIAPGGTFVIDDNKTMIALQRLDRGSVTIPFAGVNLIALVSRFHRTCCSRPASP